MHMCHVMHMEVSDNLWGSLVFFYYVGLGDHSQAVGLGGKHPYQGRHLASLDALSTGLG